MTRKTLIRTALVVTFVGLSLGGWLASRADAQQQAESIPVPSGQMVSFLQFISEREGALVRFRFLTPQIGAGFEYADVRGDFQALCDEQVMPVLGEYGLTPTQIVLSMSAKDIPFGEDQPQVLQFFEIFRPENDLCIWEEF